MKKVPLWIRGSKRTGGKEKNPESYFKVKNTIFLNILKRQMVNGKRGKVRQCFKKHIEWFGRVEDLLLMEINSNFGNKLRKNFIRFV